jgi:hypothetical protein
MKSASKIFRPSFWVPAVAETATTRRVHLILMLSMEWLVKTFVAHNTSTIRSTFPKIVGWFSEEKLKIFIFPLRYTLLFPWIREPFSSFENARNRFFATYLQVYVGSPFLKTLPQICPGRRPLPPKPVISASFFNDESFGTVESPSLRQLMADKGYNKSSSKNH